MNPDVLKRVRQVMAATFEIDEASIPDDASPENLERWDSLHNMNLIVALEQEFGIQFSDDDVMGALSLPKLVSIVERQQ